MLWDIPKIWKDGTCVVIGGGPSLIKQFSIPESLVKEVYTGKKSPNVYSPYLEPLHNMHCIAVNMSFKLGNWVDMVFFGDETFLNKYKNELLQYKGLRVGFEHEDESLDFVPDPRFKYLHKIYPQRRVDAMGICMKPKTLCWNFNSGGAAINLAAQLGVKQIILLGFDMALTETKDQHWHKYYAGNPVTVASTFKRHMSSFPKIAKDLDKLGIECINANPESKIDVFPRMNFKDIRL